MKSDARFLSDHRWLVLSDTLDLEVGSVAPRRALVLRSVKGRGRPTSRRCKEYDREIRLRSSQSHQNNNLSVVHIRGCLLHDTHILDAEVHQHRSDPESGICHLYANAGLLTQARQTYHERVH